MRKISASYIFTGKETLLKNGILIIDDNGVVIDVIDTRGKVTEIELLEHYNGILCPGFINSHCHLELSYMRGMLNKTQNIVGFIKQMLEKRENITMSNEEYLFKADKEMQINGIVACGDISNSVSSFRVKSRSNIKYYNFIEVFGILEKESENIINKAKAIETSALKINAGETSISPHAAYSLSSGLFNKVKENAEKTNSVISFHNQESIEETELFANKQNELSEILDKIGKGNNTFQVTYKSSLESIIPYMPKQNNILFIHNVFSKKEDVTLVQKHFAKYFWVLCPKSNLFISNKLPDLSIFLEDSEKICIGTDSLSSNDSLSILEEIKVLHYYFPELLLVNLLQWSTINGAKALKMDSTLGSFEKGKKAGVNLIYNLDLQNLKLTKDTEIKVIA